MGNKDHRICDYLRSVMRSIGRFKDLGRVVFGGPLSACRACHVNIQGFQRHNAEHDHCSKCLIAVRTRSSCSRREQRRSSRLVRGSTSSESAERALIRSMCCSEASLGKRGKPGYRLPVRSLISNSAASFGISIHAYFVVLTAAT